MTQQFGLVYVPTDPEVEKERYMMGLILATLVTLFVVFVFLACVVSGR